MGYRDLHDFLDTLERAGELHRMGAEVDPRLEIAEITDRISKSATGGKALLFERVKGSSFPVVTNQFGSFARVCAALQVGRLDELTERMERLLAQVSPGPVGEMMAALPLLDELRHHLPVIVDEGPCQEVVEPVPDLLSYPFLKCWPGDGAPNHDGRFLTLPLVFTMDPDTGLANCGMYRVMVTGAASAGIRWHAGKGGELHSRKYRERGERMPVAVAVGGDPALAFAAMLPLPDGFDEMQFAGFLRRAPVEMVRCRTSGLLVPAGAELVIEGYLETGETVLDGAFGNHTGFYVPPADVPLLHVTCVTRRRELIYPATVVGRPPMEDCYLAKAVERLLLPVWRLAWPDVVDVNFPLEWIFHNSAIVSVRDATPDRVRELIREIWESAGMGSSRLIVIVDDDVDVHDLSLVAWRVMNTTDWRRDLMVSDAAEGRAPFPWLGSKMAIDATRKGWRGDWPDEIQMAEDVRRLVDERWEEYGFR